MTTSKIDFLTVPLVPQMRHIVQVEEDAPPARPNYTFTCGEEVWRFPEPGSRTAKHVGTCGPISDALGSKWWPLRCKSCNIEMKRWQRRRAWADRFAERFDFKRHRFYKFLTFGLPGNKTWDSLVDYRQQLVNNFNVVRRSSFWKKHVDGGMWFFEVTASSGVQDDLEEGCMDEPEVKINPHFHCIILGPKKVPLSQLSDLFEKNNLGSPHFSASRGGDGRYCHPTPENALGYLLGYLKKDSQTEGRNRQTFGNMWD